MNPDAKEHMVWLLLTFTMGTTGNEPTYYMLSYPPRLMQIQNCMRIILITLMSINYFN